MAGYPLLWFGATREYVNRGGGHRAVFNRAALSE
jgi:hypothetical protein